MGCRAFYFRGTRPDEDSEEFEIMDSADEDVEESETEDFDNETGELILFDVQELARFQTGLVSICCSL